MTNFKRHLTNLNIKSCARYRATTEFTLFSSLFYVELCITCIRSIAKYFVSATYSVKDEMLNIFVANCDDGILNLFFAHPIRAIREVGFFRIFKERRSRVNSEQLRIYV